MVCGYGEAFEGTGVFRGLQWVDRCPDQPV